MNDELQQLSAADVWEHRQGYRMGTSAYAAMRERHRRADELIVAQALQDADDDYHAAPLFQHGETPDNAWKAHTLALRAAELGYPAPAGWRRRPWKPKSTRTSQVG